MQTDRAIAAVEPELAALLADLTARGFATPEPALVGIAEARRCNLLYFREIAPGAPEPGRAEVRTLTAEDGGGCEVEVVTPRNAAPGAPALLYCHGGGYAFGDLATHAHIFRWLAQITGMTVFGLHYRRTPEHAWPAPLLDALAAAQAIRGPDWQARYGHDGSRLLLLGDSAGAHLALAAMLALKARGLPQASGAALAYGMYARRSDTWSHHTYGGGTHGLTSARMAWFWDRLLAAGVADFAEQLDADLTGLPPLALYGAECDCLLDDTLDLREALKRIEHPASFHLFRGMLHGFLHLPGVYAGSRQALELIGADLKRMGSA
jgi:acetyl esterase